MNLTTTRTGVTVRYLTQLYQGEVEVEMDVVATSATFFQLMILS